MYAIIPLLLKAILLASEILLRTFNFIFSHHFLAYKISNAINNNRIKNINFEHLQSSDFSYHSAVASQLIDQVDLSQIYLHKF